MKIEWILCPFCGSKTRLKIRRAGNAQGEFTCDYRFFFSVYDENLPRLRGNKKAVGWSR